ncbi:hypothetical protein HDU91_007205 [Kappamyces sp. JEL0680]|nr:hypothetical protein HDU91_007205 [Kappamyces sp. JEL0680]
MYELPISLLVDVIPFNNQGETAATGIAGVLALMGFLCCILVATALYRQGDRSPNTCRPDAYSVGICCLSICTLVMIVLERYMSIFHTVRWYTRETLVLIGFLWVTCFGIISMPLFVDRTVFFLQSSKIICISSWSSHNIIAKGLALFCLSVIFSSVLFICFAYSRIVVLFFSKSRDEIFSRQLSQTPNSRAQRQFTDLQWKLLLKSFIISGTYLTCWTPYGLLVTISIATETPAGPEFDAFATILGLMNSVLNPMLLCLFDARIKKGVLRLIPYMGVNTSKKGSTQKIQSNEALPMSPSGVGPSNAIVMTDDEKNSVATVRLVKEADSSHARVGGRTV